MAENRELGEDEDEDEDEEEEEEAVDEELVDGCCGCCAVFRLPFMLALFAELVEDANGLAAGGDRLPMPFKFIDVGGDEIMPPTPF